MACRVEGTSIQLDSGGDSAKVLAVDIRAGKVSRMEIPFDSQPGCASPVAACWLMPPCDSMYAMHFIMPCGGSGNLER